MGTSLVEDLEMLFENQENCDVLFKVGGRTIGAHKFLLLARSSVLYNMVKSWNHEDDPVPIEDMDFDSFEALLRFVYTDEISLSDANVFIFLFASTHFKLPLLEELCTERIDNFMNHENVCNLMNEAINFKSTVLQEMCTEAFSKQTNSVLKDKSFMEISQPVLSALLDAEDSNVLEIELFSWVKRWASRRCQRMGLPVNGTNMRHVIGDALYKIRFPTMTVQDFGNSVTTIKGLLTDTEMALVFQMITVFDNSNIQCPFPNNFRCHKNNYYTPFNDMAELLESKVLYDTDSNRYCNMEDAVGMVEELANGGKIKVTPLRIILQCCADLANSTGRIAYASPGNHTLRKDIKYEFSAWKDFANTKNLHKIMTQFVEVRKKLDKICAWH